MLLVGAMAADNRDRSSINLTGLRERIHAVHQNLDYLREMKFSQLLRTLLVRGLESFERQYTPQTSIAYLVGQWHLEDLAAETEISAEALRRLQSGMRPTDDELVSLATALVKANGEPWTTRELMKIREASFHESEPVQQAEDPNPETKEKQPNGNGK